MLGEVSFDQAQLVGQEGIDRAVFVADRAAKHDDEIELIGQRRIVERIDAGVAVRDAGAAARRVSAGTPLAAR